MSSKKIIILKSSDATTFDVEEVVAVESETIKLLIDDDLADSLIPLLNDSGKVLSMVIEYCKKHVESGAAAYKDKDNDSNSLEESQKIYDGWSTHTLQSNTDCGRHDEGKRLEEIRKIFNIKNEYTHEEEEEVRGEN